MKIAAPLLLGAALLCATGCAARDDTRARLDHLIGQPESLVRKVMGLPTTSFRADGRTYLDYIERDPESFAGYDMLGGYGRWGTLGYRRIGFEAKPELYERGCDTRIEIESGHMAGYTLRGNACG